MSDYKLLNGGSVQRLSDMACIPLDPRNRDYAAVDLSTAKQQLNLTTSDDDALVTRLLLVARVNEQGGEIMNLPNGTQVIPHDVSMAMAPRAARPRSGSSSTLSANAQRNTPHPGETRTGTTETYVPFSMSDRLPHPFARLGRTAAADSASGLGLVSPAARSPIDSKGTRNGK